MLEETFLSRYLKGDHKDVWEELQTLCEIVEEPLRSDALAVARETMRRVKINLEIIVKCLKKLGFGFLAPDRVLVPAQTHDLEFLDDFEQKWGTLPFSVRAWYECIHSVDLFASKIITKDLIQSLDTDLIAFNFSGYSNLVDALSEHDELHWYTLGLSFLSLEESLTEVLRETEKFKQDWEAGKVDNWTRNYYLENNIDPLVLPTVVSFLPVGMAMSTCEPMGFEVGKAQADCVIEDDDEEVRFVDFLRNRLLLGRLLHGHCAKNQQYDYLYFGKMPNHFEITAEVLEGLLPF
jgi:hypothetical protein